jgi:hypothetical protein
MASFLLFGSPVIMTEIISIEVDDQKNNSG